METCPKCGAEMDMDGKYVKDYACGSLLNKSGGFLQRDACKDRQITNLQAELQECREVIKKLQTEIREKSGYIDTIY